MQKKLDEFSMQEAMRLAQSDAGKQLIALFQQKNGAAVQDLMQGAANGDMEEAKKSIEAFMQTPQAKALVRQLQEAHHGRNGR